MKKRFTQEPIICFLRLAIQRSFNEDYDEHDDELTTLLREVGQLTIYSMLQDDSCHFPKTALEPLL